jgi:hypothetical protein
MFTYSFVTPLLKRTEKPESPTSGVACPSVGVFVYVPVFAPALSAAVVPVVSFRRQ